MAILKIPKAGTAQREGFLLEESELVYDRDKKSVYCGNGVDMGGFKIGGVGADYEYCRIQLDQPAIDAKSITVPFAVASSSSISVLPEGGIPQVNTIDYEVSGNIISWDGLGLDGFLEVGEYLIITGFKE